MLYVCANIILLAQLKDYIKAARFKTLPLAISSPLVGVSLAIFNTSSHFSWLTATLCILVALGLQILSNFANDLGDFQKGTDQKAGRTDRALSSGSMEPKEMKWAIAYTILFTLIIGICLLISSDLDQYQFLGILVIGLVSILAALGYTLGKKAYGYHGFGDLFVFVFFGMVAVIVTYFLLTKTLDIASCIAGASMGFFCTMVLNINNTRDLVKDQENNKNTIPVKLGFERTRIYHITLAGFASAGLLRLLVMFNTPYIALGLILLVVHLHQYLNLAQEDYEDYNQQLKKTSLTIALIALLFFLHAIVRTYL